MILFGSRKLSTRLKNEKGASAVEFALVLPILVLLMLGIMQFGLIFFHWISITHAAREGARWASLENPEFDQGPIKGTTTIIKEAAAGLDLDADGTITVNPGSPTIADAGDPVTVIVTYNSPIIAPLMGSIFGASGNTITLTSSAVQKIE